MCTRKENKKLQTTEIFNLFLIASAIYGFVFSAVLFFSKNGKDKSMLFLNFLILVISFNNFQSWILTKNFFQYKYSLVYIQIPWHFLVAPFFYMFLVHYLGIIDKTVKILYSVLYVFIIAVILQVGFVLIYQDAFSVAALDAIFERYTSVEEIVSFFVSISIFLYSFYILKTKQKLYLKILSFDKLQWIYIFFKLGVICYVFWIIALIVKVKMDFSGFLFSYYPLRIATTLLIFWIGYQAVIQLQILKDRKNIRKTLVSENIEVLIDETLEKTLVFKKIEDYIFVNKKFTDSKISRDVLAKEMNMSKNKLSSIINQVSNKTFREYINGLRVEFAKRLLTDEKYQKYTITAIGLESGFNSKSTFYYVFKKHTGKTPLQFKEEVV